MNTLHSGSEIKGDSIVHRPTLDVRRTPSWCTRPADHHLRTAAPLHSLAIGIARDTAVSTLKYSQTNTSVSTINSSIGVLRSSLFA